MGVLEGGRETLIENPAEHLNSLGCRLRNIRELPTRAQARERAQKPLPVDTSSFGRSPSNLSPLKHIRSGRVTPLLTLVDEHSPSIRHCLSIHDVETQCRGEKSSLIGRASLPGSEPCKRKQRDCSILVAGPL